MLSGIQELLGWIAEPPPDRTLHFASPAFAWEPCSYERLARLAMTIGDGLVRAGIRRDDAVVIITPAGPQCIAAVYGAMLAGGTPAIVAPPRAFQDQALYPSHLRHVIATAAPRFVIGAGELAEFVRSATDAAVVTLDELLASGDAAQWEERPRAELALLQFTAGSSGDVRAVRVPFDALAANVGAIRGWLQWTPDDPTAFWLPHYHDMGLIGGIVAPLASRSDLWLMSPEQFVHKPLEYLRCFGERGARLTALPPFALEYILRRVSAEELQSLDFSGVKAFIVGAELIDASTLARFEERLAPFGFPRGALLPAFGLAESTLAVCGVPLGSAWTTHTSDAGAALVGCGPPLAGLEVSVVDENGRTVPDGTTGEIVVRGTSVAAGYRGTSASPSLTMFDDDGALHTGDAGFVADGQLFPIGRLGDSIKIRGRALFAELLESELAKLGHTRDANVVLAGMRELRPVVVWVSERATSDTNAEALQLLARLAEGAELVFARVPRGAIPRTSSGKARRTKLWTDFLMHGLSAIVTPSIQKTI